MKIVTVILFSRGIHKESLTYFTAKDIRVGTIVSVPVRRKLVDAFVIETKDLLASKYDIKSSTFNLKKVESIKGPSFLRPEFFKAIMETTKYFASYPGLVLNSLVPTIFIKKYEKLSKPKSKTKLDKTLNIKQEKLIFQAPLEDRLDFYKTFIRESFTKKQSVFLCLPTINEIKIFAEALEKGIERYVFVLHSDIPNKNQIETYNAVVAEAHPVLIIATGPYLFIPRNDIGAVIIEHESSSAYKTISRPFLDMRTFAEIFANETGAKFILADTLLRTETTWRHEQDELGEVVSPKFNMPSLNKVKVIDMRTSQKHENTKTKKQKMGFEVLSEEVKKLIKKTIKSNEQMFLFVLRKGLAPVTLCNDCGTALLCSSCAAPMTLFTKKDKKERVFICNKCREQKSAKVVCGECGSWNLTPLGIGVERVVEELKKYFPDIPVFTIDRDSVKTRKQGQKIIDQFYNTPGSVLVGTEMALFYLSGGIRNTAIISFDSLFSIPSFHINEKIIQLLLSLFSHTEEKLIIQTRNPEEKILEHVSNGNLIELYREELEQRKQFNYPPFKTLIKVTFAGGKLDTDQAVKLMQKEFEIYKPEIFKAYIPRIKNQYVTNMVLKLNR